MRTLAILVAGALAFTPTSGLAQRSGVLIGVVAPSAPNPFAAGANIETARYETLWIVHDERRPLRAVIPDLLVPRRDGFWRMGIASICVYESDTHNERTEDVVWRARMDSVVTVESDPACEVPDTSATSARADSADTTAAPSGTASQRTSCGYATVRVTFATSEFVGLSNTRGQSEECEPRGWQWRDEWRVKRFDDELPLPLDSIFGSRARAAYAAAVTGSGHTEEGFNCPILSAEELTAESLLNWTLERRRGRWVAVALEQPTTAACQYTGRIGLTLPRTLGGARPLGPSWSAIRAAVPNVVDAFTSPSADLAVVVTPDSLVVFESDRKTIGRRLMARPLAPYPVGRQIVMIEWAIAPHVVRWDAAVRAATGVARGVRVVQPSR